jgi:glycosyltransferase involved in cell wall biosynthesis
VRSGGGVTYLVELIANLDPVRDNFHKVIVWGSKELEGKITRRDWIKFKQQKLLNMMLPFRLYWQAFLLKRELIKEGCNILFVPGALILTNFSPVVTVCQNMLPFESTELSRFGFSLTSLKLLLLRVMHSRSFKKADGVIFLTKYAENYIKKSAQILSIDSKIINHGISNRFKGYPRLQYEYSELKEFEFLYVSTVDFYKHQWNVIEAISVVRNMGFNVSLKLIGGGNNAAIKKMSKCIAKLDPLGCWVTYMGEVKFNKLPDIYKKADVGIFASTCENLPITLL